MYATSASTSFFGSAEFFISGLRGAFVFTVMPLASTIQRRRSSADRFAPTPSSGPFLLPLSPIE
jgi:hypothetical protein